MVVASTFAMASVGGAEGGKKKEGEKKVVTSALTTTGLAPRDRKRTCAVYPLHNSLFWRSLHQRNVLTRVASQ